MRDKVLHRGFETTRELDWISQVRFFSVLRIGNRFTWSDCAKSWKRKKKVGDPIYEKRKIWERKCCDPRPSTEELSGNSDVSWGLKNHLSMEAMIRAFLQNILLLRKFYLLFLLFLLRARNFIKTYTYVYCKLKTNLLLNQFFRREEIWK